jgi:hypothetical protein
VNMVMKLPGWQNFLDFSRNTVHLEVSHKGSELKLYVLTLSVR